MHWSKNKNSQDVLTIKLIKTFDGGLNTSQSKPSSKHPDNSTDWTFMEAKVFITVTFRKQNTKIALTVGEFAAVCMMSFI